MTVQFDASKPTYFITHGYSSDTNNNWFKNLTEAILYQVNKFVQQVFKSFIKLVIKISERCKCF